MNALIANAENIVFDVGQVLLSFVPEMFLPRMLPADIARKFMPPVLFAKGAWGRMDEGTVTDEELSRVIAQEAGDPLLWPHALYVIEHFHEYMSPLPAVELLPELRSQGKRLYVLSNYGVNTFARAERHFEALFSQFDGMVISGREKVIKPDPRIYQLLLSRYGLDPAQSVFIDDLPQNIAEAKNAGMRGIVYTGPEVLA